MNENNLQPKLTIIDGPLNSNETYRYVENIGFVGLKGDLNIDLSFDILDVMMLVDYVINTEEPSPAIFWTSDINYSGDLDILDVIKLVYFILFH